MAHSKDSASPNSDILQLIEKIPDGSTTALFKGRRYLVTKSSFNNGRSFKVYAEQLGGNDFISANVYETSAGATLKPCEMPKAKVLEFLSEFETP